MTITTTLVLIRKGDEILLAMKKRGFGAGRWNGYGGKVKTGETIEESARREMWEEGRVTVPSLELAAVIHFRFVENDGQDDIKMHVFRSRDCIGEPVETEEMRPQWFPVDAIPYEEMWLDDKLWLPIFLDEVPFRARFDFGGDERNPVIVNYSIEQNAVLSEGV